MAGPYDFKVVEESILKFWQDNDIYNKAKAKGKGKKTFYFLQGPPYTSGKLHIGHAWNNSMKDAVLRFKRMAGFDVWDRAGYDMHGLPTENAVQKKFQLANKDEIIKFGLNKFADECMLFSSGNALQMDKDLERLGVWMDFKNAYWPIKNEYIEGIWWLIKKAEENKRLYKGTKVMTWCQHCETGLAKHELEYDSVTDSSIFLKFKIEGKEKEFLVIWTTTPWTIPFNMAVMVNPDVIYQKCKISNGDTWIIARDLAKEVVTKANEDFEVLEEFEGKKLEGLKYEHPLKNIDFGKFNEVKNLHTVILSKQYVDTSAGSGLVHSAPGCGPEDFEACQPYNIPPFNTLNEQGFFTDIPDFEGKRAKIDDRYFIEILKEAGALISTEKVKHDYPMCWRCHNPVVFRVTSQWFMKVEDLREKIISANKDVNWVPQKSKDSFDAWISGLKDNSITRQRFWGAPVPIWACECGEIKVIASREELKENEANKIPENLHKPWIDEVTIKCNCGKEMNRIPDVLDVWIDSGTASWNCLEWPANKELMPKLFPPDFILEATEQGRLWFSLLMMCSFVALDKPAFKNVYAHGMILDYQGLKMSKSMGNVISPYEVIDKVGADTMRMYFGSVPAGENINFVWDEVKTQQRNLGVLWNIHNYLIDIAKEAAINPASLSYLEMKKNMETEEHYMISKLQHSTEEITDLFERYYLDSIPKKVEDIWLTLSRVYIQLIRDKAALGSEEEKSVVIFTIYNALIDSLKLLAPICPFLSEMIYQGLRKEFNLKEESIHLFDWPKADKAYINEHLEESMNCAQQVMTSINAARDMAKVSLRWPLQRAMVIPKNDEVKTAVTELSQLIKSQCNIKELSIVSTLQGIKQTVKINSSKIGKTFGRDMPKVIAAFASANHDNVLRDLAKNKVYVLNAGGEKFDITPEHVIIERSVPSPFFEAEFSNGFIYLDSTQTPELLAEGYSRELTRRLQELRKEAGLTKIHQINAFIKTSPELEKPISKFKEKIANRCGVKELIITSAEPKGTYTNTAVESIKDQNFALGLMKI